MNSFEEDDRYIRAKKRVEKIKGFYIHLVVFIVINLFILVVKGYHDYKDGGTFWELESFSTVFFWGIGLTVHAISVFGIFNIFGPKWEAKQLKKFMQEEQQEQQRWE